jgi:hypothetical protein
MYVLLFVASVSPVYLGDYKDIVACQGAIREIYAQKLNVPGQRSTSLDSAIDLQLKNSRDYLCVKKG